MPMWKLRWEDIMRRNKLRWKEMWNEENLYFELARTTWMSSGRRRCGGCWRQQKEQRAELSWAVQEQEWEKQKKRKTGKLNRKHQSVINNKYCTHFCETFYLTSHRLHYEFEFSLQFSLCFHHVLPMPEHYSKFIWNGIGVDGSEGGGRGREGVEWKNKKQKKREKKTEQVSDEMNVGIIICFSNCERWNV